MRPRPAELTKPVPSTIVRAEFRSGAILDDDRDGTADFAKRLDQTAEETEALLAQLLSDALLPDEIARPKRLMDAMRYSSLGGGKRLRPFLVVESAAVFGVPREAALLAGAALECIHCYSLIHDDLPAMDNSDLRRGRPTLHKKTDDATAILAGDGAADARLRHHHPRRDPPRCRRCACC